MSLPAPLQTAKQNLWLKYHLKRSSKKPQACDLALTTPVTENSRANPISRAAERPRRASAARSAGRHPARRPAAGTVPESTGLRVTGAARAAAQAAPRSQDGGTAGERAVRGDPPGRARPRGLREGERSAGRCADGAGGLAEAAPRLGPAAWGRLTRQPPRDPDLPAPGGGGGPGRCRAAPGSRPPRRPSLPRPAPPPPRLLAWSEAVPLLVYFSPPGREREFAVRVVAQSFFGRS